MNPEFSWPEITKIENNSENAGFKLKARFPVYPEFFNFVNPELKEKMSAIKDDDDLVKERYWK